ncbi:AgmX/PglI C-terminal domain-containing protein [Hyalangium rubrum]|uniref:AgmX/PglI C-terminal domain-containing protein n=1 Tax=Hyalangium rubrum TaxID=3103134 RepID=A0ABU5GZS5_9BACT|nr:AgmX/PglI C-terminal domain-containing protein [Hyalangium sp. s54d21]MDY7226033.1 AgmX/PglI C-terminal domain-containing protein [Hyalangium sp. s54d21]
MEETAWNLEPVSGVQPDVHDALDTDLDAYLDRELFIQPATEVKPATVEKPAELLHGVLALAAEEEQWLRTLPAPEEPAENSKDLESGDCLVPEHLKPKPSPVVSAAAPVASPVPQATLPGLAMMPLPEQPWSPPMAPVAVAPEPVHRSRWLVAGALVGAGVVGVLAAGLLWMSPSSLTERAEVTPVPVAPAPESVLFVENSPLPRQSEPTLVDWSESAQGVVGVSAGALPGPVVPGQELAPQVSAPPVIVPEVPVSIPPAEVARTSEPEPASVKAEPVAPREPVQARRVPAEPRPQPRRLIEDPSLAEAEEEPPFIAQQQPAPAPVAVAKATPASPAPRKKDGYSEYDEEFARELGFTDDAPAHAPESKGPKAVYIPPAPGVNLPEKLTPQDIQQVVVANQPAIVSCLRRFKDSVPEGSGGKFVMRWFVHADGSTYGTMMETSALRGTPLATCLEGLVRGWKFPKHRVQQQEPVRFPFTF